MAMGSLLLGDQNTVNKHDKGVRIVSGNNQKQLYDQIDYGVWKGFDLTKRLELKFGKHGDQSAFIWGIQLPKPMPKDEIKLKMAIDYKRDNDEGYMQ